MGVKAKLRLKDFLVTERYYYQLTIADNPSNEAVGEPEGTISYSLPFDGKYHFTRQAYSNVTHDEGSPLPVLPIGEINISEPLPHHGFAHSLRRRTTTRSLQVSIPSKIRQDAALLIADRYHYHHHETYIPPWPVDIPSNLINVEVQLTYDDDTLGQSLRIEQQDNLEVSMFLLFQFNLTLPTTLIDKWSPTIHLSKMELNWPAGLDPDTLHFWDSDLEGLDYLYDPHNHRLETYSPLGFSRVLDKKHPLPGWRRYSTAILIGFNNPSQLHMLADRALEGCAEITIDNALLSGRNVELSGTHNFSLDDTRITCNSKIKTGLSIYLNDVYKRRFTTLRWKMFFEGVELNTERITDIVVALKDLGYHLTDEPPQIDHSDSDGNSGTAGYILDCKRWESSKSCSSNIRLVVRSMNHREVDWDLNVPDDTRYRRTIPCEDLVIDVHGILRGGNEPLATGFSKLQRRLKQVFYHAAVGQ